MEHPEIEDLLRDAGLVVDYAARMGRLPDNALLTAIAKVRSASSEAAPLDVPGLVIALNDAVRAMAPMTLAQLRAGLSPFDATGHKKLRVSQVFFSVLTIVLVALVADLTEYLHRQDAAMKGLVQAREARPLDKLNELRKMVQIESILSKQDAAHYDRYQRSVTEIRDLQNRLSGAYNVLDRVEHEGPYLSRLAEPVIWVAHATGLTTSRPTAAYGANGPGAPAPGAVSAAAASKQESAPMSYREAAEKAAQQGVPVDVCEEPAALAAQAAKKYPPWFKAMLVDQLEAVCFSSKLGLFLALPDTASVFFSIQSRMTAMNGWILPFLYGLLGACVYVMRNLLDPRLPPLPFGAALLRVSLGGIAGIVIGWFSLSTGSKPGDVATISVLPFGLAFCAGFSIDVLFSVLERVNRTLSDPPASPRTV
jgi:hypothetical protein